VDETTLQAGHDIAYANQTTLHPLGLLMVVVCGITMLAVPRRYALWPMIVMACLVAPAQRLVVLTLDFNMLRLMVIFGWLRILSRREHVGFRWNTLDSLLLLWSAVQTVTYTLQQSSFGALVNRLGVSFDAVGMYFIFRCLIRSWPDAISVVRGFMWLSLPVLAAFLLEHRTGRNLFAFFGGVPEITLVREGRMRCQGAYPHAIIAGGFWATMMPLIVAMWWQRHVARWLVVSAATACVVIVFTCASSTPVLALASGAIGAAFFPLRRSMKAITIGAAGSLVALHFIMEAPVWHLIARVSAVGGSTGYHRYKLIDRAIENFSEWWLVGTRSTAHWGWGMQDVANQYVYEGVTGGFATLAVFVAIIVVSFKFIGRAVQASEHDRRRLILSWALGVSLWVHCMVFVGISYFGQIVMIWYLTLALIGSLGLPHPVPVRMQQPTGRRVSHGPHGSSRRSQPYGGRP
jgi:hypothetical protein